MSVGRGKLLYGEIAQGTYIGTAIVVGQTKVSWGTGI